MKKISQNRGGFIQIILIIVITLVILKYAYNIDIINFLTTGKSREWLELIFELWSKVWTQVGPWMLRGWNYLFNLAQKFVR